VALFAPEGREEQRAKIVADGQWGDARETVPRNSTDFDCPHNFMRVEPHI